MCFTGCVCKNHSSGFIFDVCNNYIHGVIIVHVHTKCMCVSPGACATYACASACESICCARVFAHANHVFFCATVHRINLCKSSAQFCISLLVPLCLYFVCTRVICTLRTDFGASAASASPRGSQCRRFECTQHWPRIRVVLCTHVDRARFIRRRTHAHTRTHTHASVLVQQGFGNIGACKNSFVQYSAAEKQ